MLAGHTELSATQRCNEAEIRLSQKIKPRRAFASNGALVIDDISSWAGLLRQGSVIRILDPALA